MTRRDVSRLTGFALVSCLAVASAGCVSLGSRPEVGVSSAERPYLLPPYEGWKGRLPSGEARSSGDIAGLAYEHMRLPGIPQVGQPLAGACRGVARGAGGQHLAAGARNNGFIEQRLIRPCTHLHRPRVVL